jgi:hypothetical protein
MVVRKRREAAAGKATKRNKFSNQGASKPVIKDAAFSSTVPDTEELKMDAKRSSSFGLVEKLSRAIITTSFQLHKNPSLKETQFCKL